MPLFKYYGRKEGSHALPTPEQVPCNLRYFVIIAAFVTHNTTFVFTLFGGSTTQCAGRYLHIILIPHNKVIIISYGIRAVYRNFS